MTSIADLVKESGCELTDEGNARSGFGSGPAINVYRRLQGTKEQLSNALNGINAVMKMEYADDPIAELFLGGSFKIVYCDYQGVRNYLGIMPIADQSTDHHYEKV